jgi:hypothetical protein
MRASEFLREESAAGTVTSGSVATVSQPLGGMITRAGSRRLAKYANSAPRVAQRKTKHAIR